MRQPQINKPFAVRYNDICRYIASSAFEKIKNELHDVEWEEEEIWVNAIFSMMVNINDGDEEEEVAHKSLNDFLQIGIFIELQELLRLDSTIRSICKQELVAVQVTRLAFESSTDPEITYTKVKEILS